MLLFGAGALSSISETVVFRIGFLKFIMPKGMEKDEKMKERLFRVVLSLTAFATMALVGCSAAPGGGAADAGEPDVPTLSYSDVALRGILSLSDGDVIATPTVRVVITKGNSLTGSTRVDVESNGIDKAGLFSESGDYAVAIQLEQGGKQYLWSTANVAVSTGGHVDFGDVELQETGDYYISVEFDEALDTYGVRYTLPSDDMALLYLLDTGFHEDPHGTVANPRFYTLLRLPQGVHDMTFTAYGELDGNTINYAPIELSNKMVNPGVQTDGGNFSPDRQ